MLVLSRKRDESILVGEHIVFTIIDIRGGKVRVGIQAPRDVCIYRSEVHEAIERAKNNRTEEAEPWQFADAEPDVDDPINEDASQQGQASLPPPVRASHETIPETQMTAARLVEALWKMSLPAKKEDETDLRVAMEGGVNVTVSVLPGIPWLRFRATYSLTEDYSELDRLRLLETLNTHGLAIRFGIPRPRTLVAEMVFSYFGGLTSQSLLHALRSFVEFLVFSLREYGSAFVAL